MTLVSVWRQIGNSYQDFLVFNSEQYILKKDSCIGKINLADF